MTTARMKIIALACALGLSAAACRRAPQPHATQQAASDTAFASMQARGQKVMGVNQYMSHHVFEDLPDGGRIVLEMDSAPDTAAITRIREHMHAIAADFARGDFSKPFIVHQDQVPGTDVMTARRKLITYEEMDRPLGGEVRIRTTDSAAVAAVHAFLAFQRSAHHAAAHEGP